jgi:hypothetical protein
LAATKSSFHPNGGDNAILSILLNEESTYIRAVLLEQKDAAMPASYQSHPSGGLPRFVNRLAILTQAETHDKTLTITNNTSELN